MNEYLFAAFRQVAKPVIVLAAIAAPPSTAHSAGLESADSAAIEHGFLEQLATLCSKSYSGKMVSSDAADEGFVGAQMQMHAVSCSENEVRLNFQVNEDRSRTWVLTRTEDGIHLAHDHRHKDGTPDEITNYGGEGVAQTQSRVEFPAGAYTLDLFKEKGLTASLTNVWAFEFKQDQTFAYELRRPNRFFRVEFDLERALR